MEISDAKLDDWQLFLAHFKQSFGHPDLAAEASRKLHALRQGSKSVSWLAAEFRRLAVDVNWTQSSLMDAFYEGCLDRVKDRLSELERPATLEDYIEMAIKIDDRQYQRLQEKRSPPAVHHLRMSTLQRATNPSHHESLQPRMPSSYLRPMMDLCPCN